MSILRVHYRERQRLGADDLRLEQDYRLALGGRHVLAHHAWGIVRGLRLAVDAGGRYLLTPGVAVDGHGREIVVTAPLPVDLAQLDRAGCWTILLHYCEDAVTPCPGAPPARLKPRPVLAVTARHSAPDAAGPDLARARSAGADDFAPWPVVVARFGAGCESGNGSAPDYTTIRYAGQRAARVAAPGARASLQLGATNRRDFYHFLLATAAGAGAGTSTPRIGIDRDGTLHVWRALHIAGTEAALTVRVAKGVLLRMTAPIPAGLGTRIALAGQVGDDLRTLTASLRLNGGSATASTGLQGSRVVLHFADGAPGSAGLVDAASGLPLSFSHGRKKRGARWTGSGAFDAQPETLDARLVLRNVPPDGAPGADPCDVDRARGGNGQAHASAMRFKPAGAPAPDLPPDPRARTIHAAGPALRITGGEGDDSDATTRVSVGAAIGGAFHAALAMDGAGRLDLRAAPRQDPNGMLAVTGSVHLPPIGAKDPLLPELLMLAYIGGLRRAGNLTTQVTLTLSHPQPSPRRQGAPPAYRIALSRQPGDGYTVRRTMELLTAPGGRGDLSFRTLTLPPPSAAGIPHDTITLPAGRQAAPALEVRLLMLVETGGKLRVVESNALLFDPDNPP